MEVQLHDRDHHQRQDGTVLHVVLHVDEHLQAFLKTFHHQLSQLTGKVDSIMATLDERFDALTARADKVLTEVQAVKQALADLRAAQGTLTPAQEAKLVAAEEALGRIDEVNEDGTAP